MSLLPAAPFFLKWASERGSEAVRRMIAELQVGIPNYDLINPDLADANRQQLGIQSMLNGRGRLHW